MANSPSPNGPPAASAPPVGSAGEIGPTGPPQQDPRRLTSREKRNRIILLAILFALLMLLLYLTYYYVQNRRLPTIGLQDARSDYVQPPRYLYSITGLGPSAMYRPVGLGVADDGRVYVVDFGNRRVSVFTNAGAYLFSFNKTDGGTLGNPVHLAIKGEEVWVTDRRHRTIFVFDLEGEFLREFVPAGEDEFDWTPLALSFDAAGAPRITDVGQTELHRLLYFSVEGSITASVGKTGQVDSLEEAPGDFMFPNGVAIDRKGEVFVSDGDNRRVQVFDSAGEFLRFMDTSGVPRGIAIDSKERVYVADALAHSVDVYSTKGARITQFGERGFGPGQFNYPNDIALDSRGRIFVTDRENDQVQVWGWPVAEPPPVPLPKSPWWWLCLTPLLLLPLLLLLRRKIRIVVTPDLVAGLEAMQEIRAVQDRKRLKLVAPIEDKPLYEDRQPEGIRLVDLLTFEQHSEPDAQSIRERLRCTEREAIFIAMALRAKALGTDDQNLRLLAIVADVRTVDVKEFREVFLNRQ